MLRPVQVSSQPAETINPSPRLVHAAHEFEAQLMKELLKPLTSDAGFMGDEADSGSTGALGEFAGEALGRTLSEQGGFGIAQSIIRQLSSSGRGQVSDTKNVHRT